MAQKKRTLWAIDLNGSPLNQFGPKELEIYTDENDKVNIAIDGEVISGEILKELKEGGGAETKYVDLTDYVDDAEFDGQFVLLDKTDLDIEDITYGDIILEKVKFTVGDIVLYVRGDSDISQYPWIARQLNDEDFPEFDEFVDTGCVSLQGKLSICVFGFTKDNNLYMSFVDSAGSNDTDVYLGEIPNTDLSFTYTNKTTSSFDLHSMTAESVIESSIEVGEDSNKAEVKCATQVNEQTGEIRSVVAMSGDDVLFNNQSLINRPALFYELDFKGAIIWFDEHNRATLDSSLPPQELTSAEIVEIYNNLVDAVTNNKVTFIKNAYWSMYDDSTQKGNYVSSLLLQFSKISPNLDGDCVFEMTDSQLSQVNAVEGYISDTIAGDYAIGGECRVRGDDQSLEFYKVDDGEGNYSYKIVFTWQPAE